MIVKTFTATMEKQRAAMAAEVMWYVAESVGVDYHLDAKLTSDSSFHCLTITLIGRSNGELGQGCIRSVGGVDGDVVATRVRIASATKQKDRESLGESLGEVDDDGVVVALQSSDDEFHGLVYIVLEP